MNPEEFIKEHPGLAGKGSADGSYTYFNYLTIEETQIDKQKVNEVIEKLATNNLTTGDVSEEHKLLRTGYSGALKDIKKELGLDNPDGGDIETLEADKCSE